MKRYVLAALAIAAMAGQSVAGDLKITFKKEAKAMMMTQKSEEVHYFSPQFQRTNNEKEKKDTLTDYRDFTTYQIDHKKKTISKIALEDSIKIMELSMARVQNADPETKKKIEAMFGSSGLATTEELGTETVAGRTCKKWKITLGQNVYNISADPGLEMPTPKDAIEKGNKLKDSLSSAVPGMGEMTAKIQQEMAKIKGITLKSDIEMSIGPITSRVLMEATKVEEGPIPASVFELPKDYKVEDLGKKLIADLEKSNKK